MKFFKVEPSSVIATFTTPGALTNVIITDTGASYDVIEIDNAMAVASFYYVKGAEKYVEARARRFAHWHVEDLISFYSKRTR